MKIDSSPTDWWKPNFKESKKPGETEYESEVIIHRKGDFVMPVDILVKFDNGDSVREHWDGQDRWIRYAYDKKAKVRVGRNGSRPQELAGSQCLQLQQDRRARWHGDAQIGELLDVRQRVLWTIPRRMADLGEGIQMNANKSLLFAGLGVLRRTKRYVIWFFLL